ncbi:MAG: glutamine--fructose-6-phosphate transaminase (isomerizing) [Patescibacteria group bacterium]
MCGIVGYIGQRPLVSVLLTGLEKLEYRGYDSAGICVLQNDSLQVIKEVGKIARLAKRLESNNLSGLVDIAHTRWATHGEPNEANAHPHLDCRGDIAIVHNGIIENYPALKDLLVNEGHTIISETDSEIFAHLIEKFYQGDVELAVRQALELVDGAFGLAVIHRGENKIVVARRGSPLVIGVGEGEMFVASDIPAILSYTQRVIYLQDNEMAVLYKDGYVIKNLDGEKIDKQIDDIKWSVAELEKKGYEHFMLKEIFEQPEALNNTLRGRIKDGQIKLSVDFAAEQIKRIIITACGTSWHAGLVGKHYFESLLNIPVEVDYASEFRYRKPIIGSDDLLIAISQSGETADTLAAVRLAKEKLAKTLGIVNVVGSTITREVKSGIYLHIGPEIGVASTKAFTAQVTSLLLLALYIRQQKGWAIDKDLLFEINTLPELIRQALATDQIVKKIADTFKDRNNFLYLGRGLNFPVALEGALKLKEISYIHAEGYPAAEIKHGPIALVDKNMPVVFIATKNILSPKILSNMQEVKARGGQIIAVVNSGQEDVYKVADYTIIVPTVSEFLSPIVNIIPLQLLSYYIANAKGLDVDKPRNLAKSVTVE